MCIANNNDLRSMVQGYDQKIAPLQSPTGTYQPRLRSSPVDTIVGHDTNVLPKSG